MHQEGGEKHEEVAVVSAPYTHTGTHDAPSDASGGTAPKEVLLRPKEALLRPKKAFCVPRRPFAPQGGLLRPNDVLMRPKRVILRQLDKEIDKNSGWIVREIWAHIST